ALAALEVDGEFARHVGPPEIERILWLVVGCGPAFVLRDVIDIARVFRKTAPWIAHVVKIIGSEHVASKSPSLGPALVVHAHGAQPDLMQAGDVPTAMMETRSDRFYERQKVMVAAVNAVHESDKIRRAIG